MDPLLKLAVDIAGSEKVKALTTDLNTQKAAVAALNTALASGTITQQQYLAGMATAGVKAQALNSQLNALGQSSAMSGRGLMQLGYAVDDLQYGFSAIVNNIPQIAMGFGAGAGLAGGIAIASVAINMLIKHWTELSSALQSNWSGGSSEQLKMLAERAEKAAEAFDQLKLKKSEYEEKAGGGVEKAVVEEGVEKTRKAITDAMLASGQGAEKRELYRTTLTGEKWLMRKITGHRVPQNIEEQSQIQYEETAKKAADLLANAKLSGEAGENARSQLKELAKKTPLSQEARNAIDTAAKTKEQSAEEARAKHQAIIEREGRKSEEAYEKKPLSEKNPEAYHQMLIEREGRKSEEAYEKRAYEEAKRLRIQALEDQAKMIHRRPEQHGAEILQGTKAVVDFYQKGTLNQDNKTKIKLLQKIADAIEKERRLVFPKTG